MTPQTQPALSPTIIMSFEKVRHWFSLFGFRQFSLVSGCVSSDGLPFCFGIGFRSAGQTTDRSGGGHPHQAE
jgi:hypothetical protein